MVTYGKVTQNLGLLSDFIAQYEDLIIAAQNEIKTRGNIERQMAELPGITESSYANLQEIESVLKFLNIQLDMTLQKHYKKYLEGYARALTSRDAERYAENEQEVVDMKMLVNEVARLRNRYLAIMKGLEAKNFMLGHIVKLRVAGLEDIHIG